MPSRHRHRSGLLGAVAALLLAATLAGCSAYPFSEGDDVARSAAEDIAVEIGSHSDNTAEVTLEDMVTWWVLEPYSHSAPATTVEALAWSGRIGHESEATIDVRIHVAVEARSATTIGDRSNSAGEATVCYRLVWPRYEQARRSEIPCTDTAAPAPPVPTEHPQFTEDDTARVADILATVEGIDAIDAALHDAFPDDVVRIETALWNGETVVAVGIPAERECILVVRSPDGELTYPPFRRISLEPGETGCATDLYTSPPF